MNTEYTKELPVRDIVVKYILDKFKVRFEEEDNHDMLLYDMRNYYHTKTYSKQDIDHVIEYLNHHEDFKEVDMLYRDSLFRSMIVNSVTYYEVQEDGGFVFNYNEYTSSIETMDKLGCLLFIIKHITYDKGVSNGS